MITTEAVTMPTATFHKRDITLLLYFPTFVMFGYQEPDVVSISYVKTLTEAHSLEHPGLPMDRR